MYPSAYCLGPSFRTIETLHLVIPLLASSPMEALVRTIDTAIVNCDFVTLASVFSDRGTTDSWHAVGQGEQRSVAAHFVQAVVANEAFLVQALSNSSNSISVEKFMIAALNHLPATVDRAADNTLRQRLFDAKINRDDVDYVGAAQILAGMRMDDDPQSIYYLTASARTDVYVKIAECFLAEDHVVEADAAVTKAGTVAEAIPDKAAHTALLLRYKSTYVRVLDANRKFLAAAQRYHELSQSGGDLIDADDLLQLLGRAVTCAILAPNGPQRQRVLAHIVEDPRLPQLDQIDAFATHRTILQKMCRHQILPRAQLETFEASLAEHQKAIMGDGLTIMERGVVEHNMMAVSKLYRTIYMDKLAHILDLPVPKAEALAAKMITDGSLKACLDQVEGLLEFQTPEPPTQRWDRNITSLCVELNQVAEEITGFRSRQGL